MSNGLAEPLALTAAKSLVRAILASGTVDLSVTHAQERLGERAMDALDVENVLRCGAVKSCTQVRGTWRYRVETSRMVVVIAFRSRKRLAVITAWRKKARR